MFCLVGSEILGLLDNTLPANYEISLINRESLVLPVQIKLSKKPEIFWYISFAVFESTLNFQFCENKSILIGHVFQKLLTARDVLI